MFGCLCGDLGGLFCLLVYDLIVIGLVGRVDTGMLVCFGGLVVVYWCCVLIII